MDPWVQEHHTKKQLNPRVCARCSQLCQTKKKQNKRNTRSSPKIWDEPDQQVHQCAEKCAVAHCVADNCVTHTRILPQRRLPLHQDQSGPSEHRPTAPNQGQQTNQQQEPADTRSQARWAAARMPAEPGPRTSHQNQKSAEDLLASFFLPHSSFCSRRSSHFFLRSSVIRNIFIYIHDDFLAKRPRSDTLAGFRKP